MIGPLDRIRLIAKDQTDAVVSMRRDHHGRRVHTINEGVVVKALFGPRSFRDGRVQVYGCSPGCLLMSLLFSIILTIVLNVVLNLF